MPRACPDFEQDKRNISKHVVDFISWKAGAPGINHFTTAEKGGATGMLMFSSCRRGVSRACPLFNLPVGSCPGTTPILLYVGIM